MAANTLTRKSTGLTPAHKELLKLLAEIAVEEYLREVETADAGDTPAVTSEEEAHPCA